MTQAPATARTRVLLLWPGTTGMSAGSFGVPQLVTLGSYAQAHSRCEVHVRDLALEQRLGALPLDRVLAGDDGRGYDVVGISVYSSFDYLKGMAIAEVARKAWPRALIVAGGYHPSARPADILFEGSPFDACVVGEGEKPLVQLIESVRGGDPLRGVALGPDPVQDLEALPASDWSLLARYRTIARRAAYQAQVNLARGCPYGCSFCMERAKQEVAWRALPVDRAIEEITSLHAFLDLRTWALFMTGPLFGLERSWRREFLEQLARRSPPMQGKWLLTRIDAIDRDDVPLFAAAGCGAGFGLESGDPSLLRLMGKSPQPERYLDRFQEFAGWAQEQQLPWGANIICGHPGESAASLERTAGFVRGLFLDQARTCGFLSVDPFRLYPGSPIDHQQARYESDWGTRFHRPAWWQDGDPDFLSEWVDPSFELDYRQRAALQHQLFAPILQEIKSRFSYQGRAAPYFQHSVAEQVALTQPRTRLHFMCRYYAWSYYLGRGKQAEVELPSDHALADAAAAHRCSALRQLVQRGQLPADQRIIQTLTRVPHERFVPTDRLAESIELQRVLLDPGGDREVESPLEWAARCVALQIRAGDTVLELGGGAGYGTAVLAELVGPTGRVVSVESQAQWAEYARARLQGYPQVEIRVGDPLDPAAWGNVGSSAVIVSVNFSVATLLEAWKRALAVGSMLVLALGEPGKVRLTRVRVVPNGWESETISPPARPAGPQASGSL